MERHSFRQIGGRLSGGSEKPDIYAGLRQIILSLTYAWAYNRIDSFLQS
jgi:hypothetical protein